MVTALHIKKGSFFLLCFLTFLFSDCTKSNYRWVYYDETKCADKWDYKNNQEELKKNVVAYMGSKGVKIYEIEIYTDVSAAESCSDCNCKSGRKFQCKIKKTDVADAKKEGFFQ